MKDQILKSFYFWLIPLIFIFLWYLKDIVFLLFFSIVLGVAVQEWAIFIKKYLKIPFFINVAVIYTFFIFVFIFTLYILLPVILEEVKIFYPKIKDYLDYYGLNNLEKYLPDFFKNIQITALNFSSYFLKFLGGVFNFILILIISFYVTTQPHFFPDLFKFLFNENYLRYLNIYNRVKKRFSYWLAIQIFLMVIIGSLTYLLTFILKIEYGGLIALIAGLMEIIPILGPIIAASVAILFVITSEPSKLLWVIGGFILIQQLENNLLIPLVAKKFFEIKPLVTITSIIIGSKIGGVLGILTVLPLSVILIEIYNEFFKINKNA